MNFENWLPPTALVALILFMARELSEYLKRKNADKRKKKALKLFIARECELIRWTVSKITYAVEYLQSTRFDARSLVVERFGSSRYIFGEYGLNGELERSYVVDVVDLNSFGKYFLDIAAIDDEFFKIYDEANSAAEVVRQALDSFVKSDIFEKIEGGSRFSNGFSNYAVSELKGAEEVLAKLYTYCTGKNELPNRTR